VNKQFTCYIVYCMLKRVLQLFHTRPKQLGRWGIVYSSDDLQKRIDLANIDNCGPCKHSDIPIENKYKIQSGHFDIKKSSNNSIKDISIKDINA